MSSTPPFNYELPDNSNYRQNWLVIGDSTARRIVNNLVDCATSHEEFKDRYNHCTHLTSTESIAIENWTKPNATLGEGPAFFGLENPNCADCDGCNYQILVKKKEEFEKVGDDRKEALVQKILYFPVEYARDVTTQCPAVGVTTTQEAVNYYLERNFPPHGDHWNTTSCLLSVGFHDMGIIPDIGMAAYVENVKYYVRQIRPFCKNLVWLGMHQVKGRRRYPQTNAKVLQWNKGVQDMLFQSYPHDVVFMDTANRTWNKAEHRDNIHMEYSYYASLATFFVKNLTKFCG